MREQIKPQDSGSNSGYKNVMGDSNVWVLSLAVLLLRDVYNANNVDFRASSLGVVEGEESTGHLWTNLINL